MLKVLEDGCDPTRGTKHSACVDLYASEDVTIGAGETKLVGLGVCIDYNINKFSGTQDGSYVGAGIIKAHIDFLNSHYLQLMLRSSLGKKGLILANGVGVIDLDYKDEIKMLIYNPHTENTIQNSVLPMVVDLINQMFGSDLKHTFTDTTTFKIKKGDKIAQITLVEHKAYLFGIESDVERDGGFGSTDEKKD